MAGDFWRKWWPSYTQLEVICRVTGKSAWELPVAIGSSLLLMNLDAMPAGPWQATLQGQLGTGNRISSVVRKPQWGGLFRGKEEGLQQFFGTLTWEETCFIWRLVSYVFDMGGATPPQSNLIDSLLEVDESWLRFLGVHFSTYFFRKQFTPFFCGGNDIAMDRHSFSKSVDTINYSPWS